MVLWESKSSTRFFFATATHVRWNGTKACCWLCPPHILIADLARHSDSSQADEAQSESQRLLWSVLSDAKVLLVIFDWVDGKEVGSESDSDARRVREAVRVVRVSSMSSVRRNNGSTIRNVAVDRREKRGPGMRAEEFFE